MKRLRGFDYKRPFFYMVTLKRRPELAAFSQISDEAPPAPQNAHGRPRYLVENEITKAFARVIREFAAKWWGLWPIDCFVIMPDHIHLLIRIKDTGDQMPLGSYVYQLMKALAGEYWRLTGQAPQSAVQRTGAGTAKRLEQGKSVAGAASSAPPAPVFERAWHDWIVKKDGQLAAFTRYIRENPERAWLRRARRSAFAQKGACFSSRFGRRWNGGHKTRNFTSAATRWGTSWQRGWGRCVAHSERRFLRDLTVPSLRMIEKYARIWYNVGKIFTGNRRMSAHDGKKSTNAK